MKSKNKPGIRAKRRQKPAVRPKEMKRYLGGTGVREGLFPYPRIHSLSASIAKSGMVNSAMTRMEATVRNLAYMGT